jgi:VWFA-related protein
VILAGCISPFMLIPSSPNPPPVDYASAPSAPTPCAQANGAPADLLSTPGYLQFQAYDLDASGSPVTGLTQSDFAVRDGSTAFPIAYFHENASDTPASILIVIDASEGMFTKINARSGDSAARVHKALAKSIESFGRCDEIAIVVSGGKYASGFRPKDFGFPAALSDVTLQTGFTSDHSVTLTALDNLVASGPGNLSDAMQLGMRQFIGAYYPARVMVIVTDGLDTRALGGSQRYFLNAKLYGVTTKVIAIGHEQTSASSFPSSLQRTEALDLNAVRDFASATQAGVMLAKPVNDDDGASLAKALTTIGTQIGRSYSFGVIGPHATRPILSRTGSSTDLLSANLVPTSIVAKQASPPSTNSPAQCAAHAPPPPSITSRPGYTQLRVSVADSDGHRVDGLKQSDFLVTCDLNPLSVVYSHEDIAGIPTSVLVAVDVSTSMSEKMEGAYPEIADVIRGLNSCDDVGLLAFSDDPILVQPLSTDHYLTAGRVASLKAYGRTGLYDAINDSAEIVAKGKYPNRAIILVTDGVDNVSRASMSDVLKTLADRNVQVNVIGIGNASTALQFSLLPLGISFPGSANQKVIKGLAARTGGVDYIATSGNVENRKQLALAASHVKAALGFGYDLGFTSPSGKLDDLKISIAHHPEYAVEIVTVPTAASLIRLHPSKN